MSVPVIQALARIKRHGIGAATTIFAVARGVACGFAMLTTEVASTTSFGSERCETVSASDATAASADAGKPVLVRAANGFVSRLVIIVPYLWLLFFFLIPFAIVFKISLSQTAIAIPPYTPAFDLSDGISGFFGHGGLKFP